MFCLFPNFFALLIFGHQWLARPVCRSRLNADRSKTVVESPVGLEDKGINLQQQQQQQQQLQQGHSIGPAGANRYRPLKSDIKDLAVGPSSFFDRLQRRNRRCIEVLGNSIIYLMEQKTAPSISTSSRSKMSFDCFVNDVHGVAVWFGRLKGTVGVDGTVR